MTLAAQIKVEWGSPDVRYSANVADVKSCAPVANAVAWRGERVNLQLVVTANIKGDSAQVQYEFSDLKCGKAIIPASNIVGGFVQPVITDKFTGCGKHAVDAHGENLVADRITDTNPTILPAGASRGLWLTVQVPRMQGRVLIRVLLNWLATARM